MKTFRLNHWLTDVKHRQTILQSVAVKKFVLKLVKFYKTIVIICESPD